MYIIIIRSVVLLHVVQAAVAVSAAADIEDNTRRGDRPVDRLNVCIDTKQPNVYIYKYNINYYLYYARRVQSNFT